MRFNSINILILFLGCVMLFQITFLFFSINTYVEKKDCLVPAWHFSKSKEKKQKLYGLHLVVNFKLI